MDGPSRGAARAYWTLAVSEPAAFRGKVAEPVDPTGTRSPAGVEETVSPARPVAVRVSSAVAGAGAPTPQTFATPPPPQVCGAVQTPHVSVPPQPLGIVPQFFACAAHV